ARSWGGCRMLRPGQLRVIRTALCRVRSSTGVGFPVQVDAAHSGHESPVVTVPAQQGRPVKVIKMPLLRTAPATTMKNTIIVKGTEHWSRPVQQGYSCIV